MAMATRDSAFLLEQFLLVVTEQVCGRLSPHQEVTRPSPFPFLEAQEGMVEAMEAPAVLIHHVDTDPQLQHHPPLLNGRRHL